mgnify:CR=1 FL=1
MNKSLKTSATIVLIILLCIGVGVTLGGLFALVSLILYSVLDWMVAHYDFVNSLAALGGFIGLLLGLMLTVRYIKHRS